MPSKRARKALAAVLGALAFGFVLNMMGVGRSETPIRASDADLRKAGGDQQLADVIAHARAAAEASPAVEVRNTKLGLTAVWVKDRAAAIFTTEDGVQVSVDGELHVRRESCWQTRKAPSAPSAQALLLPLSESRVRFDQPRRAASGLTVRYEADRLGSYSSGSGELTIRDGVISGFSYRMDRGGGTHRFSVRYLPGAEIPAVSPVC